MITKIIFNWFYSAENGEECYVYELGQVINGDKITGIFEHTPEFDCEKHYCDVCFESGASERIFNLSNIFYSKSTKDGEDVK